MSSTNPTGTQLVIGRTGFTEPIRDYRLAWANFIAQAMPGVSYRPDSLGCDNSNPIAELTGPASPCRPWQQYAKRPLSLLRRRAEPGPQRIGVFLNLAANYVVWQIREVPPLDHRFQKELCPRARLVTLSIL